MWRSSLEISHPKFALDIQKLSGPSVMEMLERLIEGDNSLETVIFRKTTEIGTDGKTVDLGWYTFTKDEGMCLQVAASGFLTSLGWKVVDKSLTMAEES